MAHSYPRQEIPMVESNRDPFTLHENHISYLSDVLGKETFEHNTTRASLQRYISLCIRYERLQVYDRNLISHLNATISSLKLQLEQERSTRAEAENATRITERELERFCSGLTRSSSNADFNVPSTTRSDVNYSALASDDYEAWKLDQFADIATARMCDTQVLSIETPVEGGEPGLTISERFALDSSELEDTSHGSEVRVCRKRKLSKIEEV